MSSKKDWRREIWKKTGGVCAHCGKKTPASSQTVDHVIPKALGGGNDSRNLMPLCAKCNKDRASGEIVPETYYRFAQSWAIDEMMEYIEIWKLEHQTMDGQMTIDRYGISE